MIDTLQAKHNVCDGCLDFVPNCPVKPYVDGVCSVKRVAVTKISAVVEVTA